MRFSVTILKDNKSQSNDATSFNHVYLTTTIRYLRWFRPVNIFRKFRPNATLRRTNNFAFIRRYSLHSNFHLSLHTVLPYNNFNLSRKHFPVTNFYELTLFPSSSSLDVNIFILSGVFSRWARYYRLLTLRFLKLFSLFTDYAALRGVTSSNRKYSVTTRSTWSFRYKSAFKTLWI